MTMTKDVEDMTDAELCAEFVRADKQLDTVDIPNTSELYDTMWDALQDLQMIESELEARNIPKPIWWR